jgi:hypothetical protein
MRGMKRFLAQRPLPSMTMATWRGTSGSRVEVPKVDTGGFTAFSSRQTARISASLVCTSLSISAMVRSVSFWMSSVRRRSSSSVISLSLSSFLPCSLPSRRRLRIGHLGILAQALDDLGEILAALLGERGHRHADDLARGGRVQAQVRFADGLLHLGDHRLFPRLHADGARIEQRQLRPPGSAAPASRSSRRGSGPACPGGPGRCGSSAVRS